MQIRASKTLVNRKKIVQQRLLRRQGCDWKGQRLGVFGRLTELAGLLALGLVDDAVGALSHDANDLVLVHV